MSASKSRPAVPRPRVASGIPWWIWGVLLIVAGIVGWAVVIKAVPVNPDEVFANAVAAAEGGDARGLEQGIAALKAFPDRRSQQSLLEAMLHTGRSRPLKAVPLLQEAARDEKLKVKALSLLGSCYASASNRKQALLTLEEAVAVDEHADDARLNIVRLLTTNLSWDEALAQSEFLIAHKARLPEALNLRADIFYERGQYAEAADAYQASIEANIHDPSNGTKVNQLLKCLSELGEHERAERFIDGTDSQAIRECMRAEALLAEGKVKEATTALEVIRVENPNDPWMTRIYGKAMLTYQTPEKAAEGVAVLRPVASIFTRDMELYEVFAQLAAAAGETELAALLTQNVDQMNALHQEVAQQLAEVTKTRDDEEARIKLAHAAAAAGRFDLSRKAWEALMSYFPEREGEFMAEMMQMIVTPPPLVPFATSGDAPAK